MFLLAAPIALMTACSDAPVAPDNGATDVVDVAPTPVANEVGDTIPSMPSPPTSETTGNASAAAEGETVGGDGSKIALAPLQPDDATGLPGELACSFRLADVRQPMLIGRADVDDEARGVAVIRNGDYVERLVARSAGGFGAMERGIAFGGRGMTVTIDRGERVSGGESPSYDATLLAQRADGAERRYRGLWTCGP